MIRNRKQEEDKTFFYFLKKLCLIGQKKGNQLISWLGKNLFVYAEMPKYSQSKP